MANELKTIDIINQLAYVFSIAFLLNFGLNLPNWIGLLLGAMTVYVVLYEMPKNAGKQRKPTGSNTK